jgi:hypothetical protein
MYNNLNNLLSNTDLIDYFISSSNLATFPYRLYLILLLSKIALKHNNNELGNVLNNVYMYYNINYMLNEKYSKFKEDKINEIDIKIKNLIKIAKWDIRNYFNFRDNIKRNYKQLNKLLKQNENIYATYTLKDIAMINQSEYTHKTYLFDKVINNTNNEDDDDDDMIIYEIYISQIKERLKSLKSLDANTNTKMFKQKGLLDLMMKLKEIGISSNYKFIVDEIFNKFKYIKLNNRAILQKISPICIIYVMCCLGSQD